ncbi:MAG: hypothetical protein WAU92_18020, partial [Candidatus Sulfotelmatobacter sp.]
PALDLIDQIPGRDVVILIDSVDTDAAPGTVLLYRKDEIMRHRPALRMDPHSHALVDTLISAERSESRPQVYCWWESPPNPASPAAA